MKNALCLVAATGIILISVGCEKDKNTSDFTLRVTINGNQWTSVKDSSFSQSIQRGLLPYEVKIVGSGNIISRLEVNLPTILGSFPITMSFGDSSLAPSIWLRMNGKDYLNNFNTGSLTIKSMGVALNGDHSAEGTFEVVLYNAQDVLDSVVLQDGKFNVEGGILEPVLWF